MHSMHSKCGGFIFLNQGLFACLGPWRIKAVLNLDRLTFQLFSRRIGPAAVDWSLTGLFAALLEYTSSSSGQLANLQTSWQLETQKRNEMAG
jgi:hypothetical protein